MDADDSWRRLRVQPDDQISRALPRQHRRLQRIGAGHRPCARRWSRRPRARNSHLAHRRASLQDGRRRLQARHFRGPDRGHGVRQADAARIARAGARAAAARGKLRLRLHLRVHVDVVARRDQPAARRNQSAHGVRAALRRRREHGADSAHGTAREPEERARLRNQQPDPAAGHPWGRRQAEARRISRIRARYRAPHPARRRTEHHDEAAAHGAAELDSRRLRAGTAS